MKDKNKQVKDKHHAELEKYFDVEEQLLAKNEVMMKVCYYCGNALTHQTINTGCAINRSSKF